jgi:hypothetical protein
MKGISITLASVAGLGGAIVAVVGAYLLASGGGVLMLAMSSLILLVGLAVIGLGVLSIR